MMRFRVPDAIPSLCSFQPPWRGQNGDDGRRVRDPDGNMALSCLRRRSGVPRGLLLCFQGNQGVLPKLDESSLAMTTHRSKQITHGADRTVMMAEGHLAPVGLVLGAPSHQGLRSSSSKASDQGPKLDEPDHHDAPLPAAMVAGWVCTRMCRLAGSASSSVHRLQRRHDSASVTNVEGAWLHEQGRPGPQAQVDDLDLDSPHKESPGSMDEEDDRDPKSKLSILTLTPSTQGCTWMAGHL